MEAPRGLDRAALQLIRSVQLLFNEVSLISKSRLRMSVIARDSVFLLTDEHKVRASGPYSPAKPP